MAFLGGGVLLRARPFTPTRSVQRLSQAVVCAAKSVMARLSRGRSALPPLHDEGNAFVVGGGDVAAPVLDKHRDDNVQTYFSMCGSGSTGLAPWRSSKCSCG